MSRILLVCEGESSTKELMQNFMGESVRKGLCSVECVAAHQVTKEIIYRNDILVTIRAESPMMCEVMKQARRAGRFVVAQLDDDLQHLPKSAFRFPGRTRYLHRCLNQAQVLLTTNQLLLEEYAPFIDGGRGIIGHTAVPEDEVAPRIRKRPEDMVKIVYAASPAHVGHWEKYVAPIWDTLSRKYGERISLTFVGLKPPAPVGDSKSKVEYVPPMKLAEYRKYMYGQHFDIGLSPLEPDHFNERKYFNKFFEYSMCGICGVYSDCAPYNLVIRQGINGILAGHTPEDWLAALEQVIEDQDLMESCIQNAQQQLLTQFSEKQINEDVLKDIPELEEYRAPDHGDFRISLAAKLEHGCFRGIERAYLAFISLKRYGWKATAARVLGKLKKR